MDFLALRSDVFSKRFCEERQQLVPHVYIVWGEGYTGDNWQPLRNVGCLLIHEYINRSAIFKMQLARAMAEDEQRP
ncbi:hypothetical protein WJX73_000153 [Symbiochloris irregularis]|uniref:Uncharacterized protein n=1 Tax=Symbiochloris irregularis TaxID=706552 RepID=A0AAW1P2G8_9CHLO